MLDFRINSDDYLSKLITKKGITTWSQLVSYVKHIPYGRNSNRTNSELVILEDKGTCSSKHALLKKVADLNNIKGIQLIIGIYKMNALNTPKIGTLISDNNLSYIPEAHCYLRYNNQTIDITSNQSDFDIIRKNIIVEKKIEPYQVGDFKIKYHQDYIKNWIITEKLNFSFNEIWKIREQCIYNLSQF